ncbi:hypothetical protein THAOC_37020 [Thalassiosira oceanica]|uniref:Uncharacterized protein n=1 Tax=Thalassiosira oceanica TaxID=159749 RepID=K0R0V0_THAOC|nr:hypothetical protein THAOC_37020 [Thalassiosira oceanica]|eukprot:EJK44439.1 hypothetical protein THAOC_37020 [Thalassiosira oceanica]
MADSNNPDVRRERLRIAKSVTSASGIVFYCGDGRLALIFSRQSRGVIDEKIEKALAILRTQEKKDPEGHQKAGRCNQEVQVEQAQLHFKHH